VTTHVVSPVEFDGTEVEITGAAYQHLFRARRLRVGEEVRIVDGAGRARRGVVGRVDRARGVVALGSAVPACELAVAIELLVAPPKPDRAAWLVEKVTELGARAIRFVATERTARDERSFAGAQVLRLNRVAVAAVEQCGRAVVPEIGALEPLALRLEALVGVGVRPVVLDATAGVPTALPAALAAPLQGRVAIAIGPEGGWGEEDRRLFERFGLAAWSLGERVLRVETAAVAATALVACRAAASGSVDTPPVGP